MQVVNRLLPDRRGSQSSGADGVFGCLQSCVGTLIVAITLGIALLLAVTVLGRAAWDRVTSDDDAASVAAPRVETPQDESPAAPQVEATDLAVVEGPWRIRNEELSMGGLTAPYVVVERGTFTEDGDGRLVGTSDGGDFAFGFDLVSSSANERVYTATFMGAQYTLTFDEPGHFVGEVVLDGVLERRIEGWSELDENGTPRRDLPEVGEYESTADPSTESPGGGSP
jgi:hypothetical protein